MYSHKNKPSSVVAMPQASSWPLPILKGDHVLKNNTDSKVTDSSSCARRKWKKTPVAASIAALLLNPLAAYAADIVIDVVVPDGGEPEFSITGDNDGNANTINGVPFTAELEDGIAVFRIKGDLALEPGDTLTGYGDAPIALLARNDINLTGVSVDVSAQSSTPGPGGGAGGSGGDASPTIGGGGGGGDGGGGGAGGSVSGSGSDGADGTPGLQGGAGSSGTSGSRGGPAFSNNSGAGDAGRGGSGGVPGGAQVAVGAGADGRTKSFTECSSAAPAGGAGGDGLTGGAGGSGTAAEHGRNDITGEGLSGGGAGGGGGGGGSGGGGGGGAGGGGGGGGCGIAFEGGARGGNGSGGGSGGESTLGVKGGSGGGGGGAIELHAFGRATFAGELAANGGNGFSQVPPPPGNLGNRASDPGGGSGSGQQASSAGGKGGEGGQGGMGGLGGSGGDGAGGTIKLVASLLNAADASVSAAGGSRVGEDGDGRLLLASNAANPTVANIEGAVLETFAGPRALNTFIDGTVNTPYIAGLLGGAEVFGLTGLTSGDFPDVVSNANGAAAALVRLTSGPGAFADVYAGHDFLFFINLTSGALNNPRLGIGRDGFLDSLKAGGVEADPDFGGSGPRALSTLDAAEVYALLIPSDVEDFNFAADTAGGSEIANTRVLSEGGVLYLDGGGTTPPPPASGGLAASVLPGSRSVQTNNTATVFASMINSSASTGTGCKIEPITTLNANFSYQTTDPATNRPTGSANQPVDIPAGALQTFILSFMPQQATPPTDVRLRFGCDNLTPAPEISGVSTVQLSASDSAVPDVVALAGTLSNDGTVRVPGGAGVNALSVATVNVGTSSDINVTADTGNATLPVNLSVCETDPVTGACLGSAGASVSTSVGAGETPTFSVFVQARGNVSFDPGVNRIFVRFRDAGGVVRGSTSVAVTTQ